MTFENIVGKVDTAQQANLFPQCFQFCINTVLIVILTVEDSGTEVERQPLVPKVLDSNPVLSGLCLWDCSTQTARVLVMYPGSRHRA